MRVAARSPSHLTLFSSSSSSGKYNKFFGNPPQFPWSPNVVSILSCNNTFSTPKLLALKTCCCHKHNKEYEFFEDFSVLSSDVPWDSGSIWSTMALYLFSLHIPLSFGGLSIVAQLLHQTVLNPKTVVVSLLMFQSIELLVTFPLLLFTGKGWNEVASFFQEKEVPEGRNWIQGSALGFGSLMLLVLLTSLIADKVIGHKAVNNSMLKEILSSGSVIETACFFVYCFITPLLEETVYRGFLLTSLASTMKWWQAVILSACVFSMAHLSAENSLQLFFIGCPWLHLLLDWKVGIFICHPFCI